MTTQTPIPAGTLITLTRDGQLIVLLADIHWDSGRNFYRRVWPPHPPGVKPSGDKPLPGEVFTMRDLHDPVINDWLLQQGLEPEARAVVRREARRAAGRRQGRSA